MTWLAPRRPAGRQTQWDRERETEKQTQRKTDRWRRTEKPERRRRVFWHRFSLPPCYSFAPDQQVTSARCRVSAPGQCCVSGPALKLTSPTQNPTVWRWRRHEGKIILGRDADTVRIMRHFSDGMEKRRNTSFNNSRSPITIFGRLEFTFPHISKPLLSSPLCRMVIKRRQTQVLHHWTLEMETCYTCLQRWQKQDRDSTSTLHRLQPNHMLKMWI